MLEKISSINIKNDFFKNETTLKLFEKPDERISFIYGRNGSGKTTISNAFLDIKNGTNNFEIKSLLDANGKEITLTDGQKSRIYVFNESFIDENLKFTDEDGLNTIVMFGKQIKLDNELKEKEKALLQIKKDINEAKNLDEKLNNEKNVSSFFYWKEQIKKVLRKTNGWSEREQKIKGNVSKTPINDNIFNQIIEIELEHDIDGMKDELEHNLDFISKFEDSQNYPELNFEYNIMKNYDIELKNILSRKIEKPILTEREKKIFSMLSDDINYIEDARQYFENDENTLCPYCFQELKLDYKEKLLNEFRNILNEDVEEYKKELKMFELPQISLNLKEYEQLDSKICHALMEQMNEINEKICSVNNTILVKESNVYNLIDEFSIDVGKSIEKFKNDVLEFSKYICITNDKIIGIKKLKKEMSDLNKIVARFEIKDELTRYKKSIKEKNNNDSKIDILNQQMESLNNEINIIKSKLKNFSIAEQIINDDLAYMFLSNDRLSIRYIDNKYHVLSRGSQINMKKLSTGERNAIALCYFFAQVLENTNEDSKYSNEFFLIIDDPISSFDYENKIGIYSFFRFKLDTILKKSQNKIIILTHELEAILNFEKYGKDLKYTNNKKFSSIMQLYNYQIKKYENIDHNVYTQSLNQIYNYANDLDDSLENTIGNSMRKVLEAYSTFVYKVGMDELTRNSEIISKLPYKLRKYYSNFMYRFILNSESHMEEKMDIYPHSNFFEIISPNEKKITAKRLLIFLYLDNKIHLKKHLNNNNYLNQIKQWCTELKNELGIKDDTDDDGNSKMNKSNNGILVKN